MRELFDVQVSPLLLSRAFPTPLWIQSGVRCPHMSPYNLERLPGKLTKTVKHVPFRAFCKEGLLLSA